MALTRQTASAIVDVVAADPRCQHQIKSVFALVPGGQGGATRNMGMATLNGVSSLADEGMKWLVNRRPDFSSSWLGQYLLSRDLTIFDPSDPSTAQYLCTGIAEATLDAIRAATAKKAAALAKVASADVVSRSEPFEHSATLVVSADGGEYVFDWWKTLHPWCPMIYRRDDFLSNRGGVPFVYFGGWV
jgi:hypothetical protein